MEIEAATFAFGSPLVLGGKCQNVLLSLGSPIPDDSELIRVHIRCYSDEMQRL